MKNHSFMFLDSDFPEISNFCMRMEKNIVEGDGVDAVIWAGKIAEWVTQYITKLSDRDMTQSDQKTKLNYLNNKGVIPKKIFNQLDFIRQYRNIATHQVLRDEMNVALKAHKKIFNILCYFYSAITDDESYMKIHYPGISYRHDENFLNQIKDNINNNSINKTEYYSSDPTKLSLYQHKANYDVHDFFNQENVYFNEDLNAYTAFFEYGGKKITIGHFKTKEVAVKRGFNFILSDSFKVFEFFKGCIMPEKLDNGKYSNSKGIDFDEKELLWKASFDGQDLGYFISENNAIIARKEYIDTLPLPEPKNGSYSDYKEISFDKNHKLWYIKKDGKILDYYDSEREAIENLSNVYHLEINLKDLGIVENEQDGRWKIFYKNKYVTTCDTKRKAIKERLKYISGFAQPKRNKDGLFSIHKGITYDEKNLIWTLTIKGERLGFFDSEEDAFNFKKDFLKSKGFDVSALEFHKEESFDDSFDFKVKINSDENAIAFDESSGEWVVYFRGMERDRCTSEEDAIKSRRKILKGMPYPPRKSNGKYSFIDGIDYDIDKHLWLAKHDDEILGYFDSEEDAFYGLKEALIAKGVDVSDMHFINSDLKEDQEESLSKVDKSKSLSDENDISLENNETEGQEAPISYYDIFRTNTDKYILNERSDVETSLNGDVDDEDSSLTDSDSTVKDSLINDAQSELDISLAYDENLNENSADIEEYKKSSFYGLVKKENKGRLSYEYTISDLDMDEEDDFGDELDLNDSLLDKDNGFLNVTENLFKKENRKDLKEIKFNSYDSKGFRREIILSYNDTDLCISLEGMVNKAELKNILFLDLLDNMVNLNYSKEDEEYFSIFVKLHYKSESLDLNELIHVLSSLGWEFDLLTKLGLSENLNINLSSNLNKSVENLSSNLNKSVKDSSSKELKESSEVNSSREIKSDNLKSKDYLSTDASSKRKTYPKQSQSTKEKSIKDEKTFVRGGVRVSYEEAMEIDNAETNSKIKSNIIDKRPEKVKEFRTNSLGNILASQRTKEEKTIDENLDEDSIMDTEDFNYISQSSLNDDFDSVSYSNDYEEDNKNDLISYGDVLAEDNLDSPSAMEDIFDNDSDDMDLDDLFDEDSDSSFEDELDGIASSNNESLTAEDRTEEVPGEVSEEISKEITEEINEELTDNDSEKSIKTIIESIKSKEESIEDGENDLESNESNDEDVPKVSKEKKPKVKKAKKEKRIAVDAFDEKYANSTEIEYDEENEKWIAYLGGDLIKSFPTPKEAYIERKKLLRRLVKKPRPGLSGKYSDLNGIDFDFKEGLWTITVNDIVVGYSISEKEALIRRKVFVDLILGKFDCNEDEFSEEIFNQIKDANLEDLFKDLSKEDLEDHSDVSLKEVKKELTKF